jgi:hypothetical protein
MNEPMNERELREIEALAEKVRADKRPPFSVIFRPERELALDAVPRMAAEIRRLREALKGAMVVAETAKGITSENAALRAELEAAKVALDDMRFAYVNKDADLPHQFETLALMEVEKIIGVFGARRDADNAKPASPEGVHILQDPPAPPSIGEEIVIGGLRARVCAVDLRTGTLALEPIYDDATKEAGHE